MSDELDPEDPDPSPRQLNQERANELIEKANSYHSEGNKAAAVPLYQEAMELFPGYGMFNLVVGDSLRELGRPAEAADAYRALVELEPEHDQAWQSLGEVAHELGDEKAAKLALTKAEALRTEFGIAPPTASGSDQAGDAAGANPQDKKPGFFARLFGR